MGKFQELLDSLAEVVYEEDVERELDYAEFEKAFEQWWQTSVLGVPWYKQPLVVTTGIKQKQRRLKQLVHDVVLAVGEKYNREGRGALVDFKAEEKDKTVWITGARGWAIDIPTELQQLAVDLRFPGGAQADLWDKSFAKPGTKEETNPDTGITTTVYTDPGGIFVQMRTKYIGATSVTEYQDKVDKTDRIIEQIMLQKHPDMYARITEEGEQVPLDIQRDYDTLYGLIGLVIDPDNTVDNVLPEWLSVGQKQTWATDAVLALGDFVRQQNPSFDFADLTVRFNDDMADIKLVKDDLLEVQRTRFDDVEQVYAFMSGKQLSAEDKVRVLHYDYNDMKNMLMLESIAPELAKVYRVLQSGGVAVTEDDAKLAWADMMDDPDVSKLVKDKLGSFERLWIDYTSKSKAAWQDVRAGQESAVSSIMGQDIDPEDIGAFGFLDFPQYLEITQTNVQLDVDHTWDMLPGAQRVLAKYNLNQTMFVRVADENAASFIDRVRAITKVASGDYFDKTGIRIDPNDIVDELDQAGVFQPSFDAMLADNEPRLREIIKSVASYMVEPEFRDAFVDNAMMNKSALWRFFQNTTEPVPKDLGLVKSLRYEDKLAEEFTGWLGTNLQPEKFPWLFSGVTTTQAATESRNDERLSLMERERWIGSLPRREKILARYGLYGMYEGAAVDARPLLHRQVGETWTQFRVRLGELKELGKLRYSRIYGKEIPKEGAQYYWRPETAAKPWEAPEGGWDAQ